MRHLQLASGGRIVDAEGLTTHVDAVEAVGGAHARPDGVLLAQLDLAHDVRISEVRPGHADHVDLALAYRVPSRCHVVDLRGMEHRQVRVFPHHAGEVEVWGRRHAVYRDDLVERGVVHDVAADDVDEVDQAFVGEDLQRGDSFRHLEPVRELLVDRHPHAHDEIGAHALADSAQHVEREAEPVGERATPVVGAVIRVGREELVEQVPVRLDLDAVHSAGLHSFGSVGVVPHDAFDVVGLGLLRVATVRWFAKPTGRHDGQPVVLSPSGTPAEVGDLDHAGAVVLVHAVGEPLDPGDDLVHVREEVPERRRAVGAHHGGAGGHGEGHASLGLLGVVGRVTLLRHTVLAVGRLVRGAHDAVLQPEVLQLKRL